MDERKRTGAYYRGHEDALDDCPPDYGQGTRERFEDYCDGYRAGLRERQEAESEKRQQLQEDLEAFNQERLAGLWRTGNAQALVVRAQEEAA